MDRTRREFLKQAGASVLGASALTGAAPLVAAAPAAAAKKEIQSPTLIAVYLRGGADQLACVVPYTDKEYRRHRPTLALADPEAKEAGAVLPLDGTFGLNPNLRQLHALYKKGLCVPVVACGSPHPTRSHFDAQDFMERAAPGQKAVSTGWLNRYLQETRSAQDANLRAASLQALLPRSLRGPYPVLARPDQDAELALRTYSLLYNHKGKPGGGSAAGGEGKKAIEEFGARTIEQLAEMNQILEHSPPPAAKYPDSGFGRQMRDLAKLVKARRGLEVTALDYGGWDHHINLGPVNGAMGKQLADVSAAVGAFVDDVGPKLMANVLILVMSEFGRTVTENSNKGTDHGHGGFMLAVGGRVNGGAVYGKWTGLGEGQLYEKRDLPVHTDFRTVFAEVLKAQFGFDAIKVGMFPEYTPDSPPLGFLKGA
jgi:uncharacterized protein (DUF1501 family)